MDKQPEGAQGEALDILTTLVGGEHELTWDGPDLHVKFLSQDQPIIVGRDGSIMWGDE